MACTLSLVIEIRMLRVDSKARASTIRFHSVLFFSVNVGTFPFSPVTNSLTWSDAREAKTSSAVCSD